MFNPDVTATSTFMTSVEAAARSLKVEPIIAPVHGDAEVETAIMALGREPGGGLVVSPHVFTTAHRMSITLAVARNNVPAVYWTSDYVRKRRLVFLRTRRGRPLSSCRLLCRSHPARREAGRSSGAVSDKIRDGRKRQDRQGA